MNKNNLRSDGRMPYELRPIHVRCNAFGYADGSVLFELGDTKVLCSVSLIPGVPSFLRGKNSGWLTAEYSMLPTATHTRTQRDGQTNQRNGRALEISRFIGRSLRTIVNLQGIKDATIYVDCDVLQADGSTRTASVTGAYIALCRAQEKWLSKKIIEKPIITDVIGSVSIGIRNNQVLVDLNYNEDSTIDADYNLVLTKSGNIVEIQGTAEQKAICWKLFDTVRCVALEAVAKIVTHIEQYTHITDQQISSKKSSLFSLQNRQNVVRSSYESC